MSKPVQITIAIFVFAVLSCTGFREIERKDNLGRVTAIMYYNGNSLERVEEIEYYGNSHNPSAIIYKKEEGRKLSQYKSERYIFKGNNLVELSFFIYRNNGKIKTGMIKYYYYPNNNFKRIEYFSSSDLLTESEDKMFIFGLDQYTYKSRQLISRRIIEYEFNPQTKKSMQIGQYVVYYNNGSIASMKSWILDRKSKKVVEKNEKNILFVSTKIKHIEEFYITRSRGKDFLMQ
ncbi:MAG: hypothetical protein GY754_04875 [bacterium]|nr:hypothetical protein [bacterium]